MRFTDLKSETLNLRVSKTFKRALKEAAEREQRSMVNMLEVLLSDYCEQKNMVLSGQDATLVESQGEIQTGSKNSAEGVV